MKRSALPAVALVISVSLWQGLACAGPIEIVAVEPTPLFPRGEPLMQVARLAVSHRGSEAVEARAKVTLGDAPPQETPLGAVAAGESIHDVLVPAGRSDLRHRLRSPVRGHRGGRSHAGRRHRLHGEDQARRHR